MANSLKLPLCSADMQTYNELCKLSTMDYANIF